MNGVLASTTSYRVGSGMAVFSVVAATVYQLDGPAPTNCSQVTYGPCLKTTCNYPLSGNSAPWMPVSAGPITLSGAARPVTIAADANGKYGTFTDSSALLWTGGESLTFSAPGASASGFAQTLIAPSMVTIAQPVVNVTADTITVSRGSDLDVAWSGASAGSMVFTLASHDTTTGLAHTLSCTFDATIGRGLIPAAGLATLPADGVVANAWTESSATQLIDGLPFGITAQTRSNASGDQFQASVDFEP